MAELLAEHQGIYTTHMRTEYDGIDAMHEAFHIGRHAKVLCKFPTISAGAKTGDVQKKRLPSLKIPSHAGYRLDCYPYRAGSSNLDITQVTEDYDILITWSTPFPDVAGKTLKEIAAMWSRCFPSC